MYPNSFAAFRTLEIFSELTLPLWFNTLEAVPWETPANLAMSLIVANSFPPLTYLSKLIIHFHSLQQIH